MAIFWGELNENKKEGDSAAERVGSANEKRDKSRFFDFVFFAASATMPPPVEFFRCLFRQDVGARAEHSVIDRV